MSLLMRMMKDPFFADKRILVVEQDQKAKNDRTWCFWEQEPGLFEPIVAHRWEQVHFYSRHFSKALDLMPYQYKMIRGIDFYSYVKAEAANHKNIEWCNEKVLSVNGKGPVAEVLLESGSFSADWVFNSILFETDLARDQKKYYLQQHFKGWVIETTDDCFDPSMATYMDFRVGQEAGTTFMYVLPLTKRKALVEYTLFTEHLLEDGEYVEALKKYIYETLHVAAYTVEHEENGIIPMTNYRFPLQHGRVVYMGIAGGQVKASSGYAFQLIQKRTADIIDELLKGSNCFNKYSLRNRKFHLYDSVLLNILHGRKMQGEEIFAAIFKKNPAQRVLRFLDNESDLLDDLQIMRSVPSGIFLPAACREFFR